MKFATIARQGDLLVNRLSKIKSYVTTYVATTVEEELSADQIEDLYQYVEECRSKHLEFEKARTKLLSQDSIADYDESQMLEIEDKISKLFFSIKSMAKPLLTQRIVGETSFALDRSTSSGNSSALKLPPLTLKTFNGAPEQWLSFCALYESSVHTNSSLSDVEKFQYLISSLHGEPLNLVKNLPISVPNYSIAWNMLQQRYHNNRKIVMLHVNNLIDLPSVTSPNSKQLRLFIAQCQENCQALMALKHDVKKNNIILSSILLRKLSGDLRKKFEDCRTDAQKMPEVQEILNYLENECSHLEAANLAQDSTQKTFSSNFSHTQGKTNQASSKGIGVGRAQKTVLISTNLSKQTVLCSFCGSNEHKIYQCTDFQNLSAQDKFEFIRNHRYCFNCLNPNHSLKECKSRNVCSKCKRKHHTWLHLSNDNTPKAIGSENKQGQSQTVKTISASSETNASNPEVKSNNPLVAFSHNSNVPGPNATILLGTTLVQITATNGNSLVVRAVVDTASMVTCISENTARLLALERSHGDISNIDGISSFQIKTKGLARVNILALHGTAVAKNHPVIILDKITSKLPHSYISHTVQEQFKNLVLADPTFYIPSAVDMLIGADLFGKIIRGDQLAFGEGLPIAMNSIFGFIIIGSAPSATPSTSGISSSTTLLTTLTDVDLHQSLQRFWMVEEPPLKTTQSPEETFCETHFLENHSRDAEGRYLVRLPFKEPHPPLGNSFNRAKQRFLSLERRLNANPDLRLPYVECMTDYLQSGHMELVTSAPEENSQHFFLPHHAVVKEESSSTKTRVVFDASAPTSTGVSLNQILHSGPKLHNQISDILLDFRCYSVVFSCDIKKMFRQIQVHPEDRKYQLLLWRENSFEPLSIYALTTVVFGFSSSPYIALRTVKQLVNDEGKNYPLAAKALQKQIYVDDLFLGANSLEEAKALQQETIELFSKGGFDLRKWKTNCPALVTSLPEEHKEKPIYFQELNHALYSFLGIKWTSETDSFTFHFKIERKPATKRNILSTVAQIFDPCGWLSPITFWTKALLQLLWTQGVQWDEPVAPDLAEKWERFLRQLPELDKIGIPRCLHLHTATDVQLHGFSDGSDAGFGAVVYVRLVSPDGVVRVQLLIAKSKVAPLKKLSIPRLELCGAYLLAKLLNYSINLISKHCTLSSTTAWCDSTVVLSWIHTPSYRLKVYVANRVTQIQDWLPSHMWSYVSTHCNPADCASRGLLPAALNDHQLWWQGPPWLLSPENSWPTSQFSPLQGENLPEIKSEPLQILITTHEPDFLQKFSSWSKLLRVIAYVLRFVNNSRKQTKLFGSIKLHEIKEATLTVCKMVQQSNFSEDIKKLQSNEACSSHLLPLSPFIDGKGLVRVGGRIKNSTLSFETKHPIILPKKHHVTDLIIDYYHIKYLHVGPSLLQATLSQKFWILSARSIIRNRIHKCQRCFRCQPKPSTQKMGELPVPRVTIPSRVFENTGTDFLGHFFVKPHLIRKINPMKVYICVFICFAVKAVHLEVVTDLTAEAYTAALYRFVSRRGLCRNIYSDQGTNYVGAASELKKIIQSFLKDRKTQNAMEKFSLENNIQFHFLPPAAPHQGGLWERAVRSIKYHFRRVVGEQILTLEEFITLSNRIEAVLNSRPLTPLSSDPSELDYLTPGHFLIGGPLLTLPEPDWKDTPSNRLSRWQMVQALTQSFWRRWRQEYLQTLQHRGKWRTTQNNLKIGDLVVIHEPNVPPLSWRLGRVTGTSPGSDGLVRVVHMHTARGAVSRPITKVSPLPLEE